MAGFEPCGAIRRGAVTVIVPQILHPFPDVAVHIVEAPGIGLFAGDRMRPVDRVPSAPGHLVQGAGVVTGGCCSAGIFPFRFGRQANVTAGLFAEPPAECDCIVPANMRHGFCFRLGKPAETPVGKDLVAPPFISMQGPAFFFCVGHIAGGFCEQVELFEGDFRCLHVVAVVDGDLVRGQFIRHIGHIDIDIGASHGERAGLDANKVKLDTIDGECKCRRLLAVVAGGFAGFLRWNGSHVSLGDWCLFAAHDSKAAAALSEGRMCRIAK